MDLSYLRSRSYSDKAAAKIVGDHYQLDARQRRAVLGASCSDESLDYRRAHRVPPDSIMDSALAVDGYNILIAAESALSGGILLRGRDGHIRDLASLHGSYRRVSETLRAIGLLGRVLGDLGASNVRWYFDAPVSNSGKLKALFEVEAGKAGWNWSVRLDSHTDKTVSASKDIVVSSDSWILDRAARSFNLLDPVLEWMDHKPDVIDLQRIL